MITRRAYSVVLLILLNLIFGLMSTSVHADDLYSALMRGDLEKAKRIIAQKKNIDAPNKKTGWTPLMVACEKNYLEVVKLLVDKGANIEARNNGGATPFYVAVYHGHADIVHFLAKRGVNLHAANNGGNTPLMAAIESGHAELIKWLIERGAEIDTSSDSGWTPVMFAAQLGEREIVENLVARGAKVNSRNKQGGSPLFIAAYNGKLEVVKSLVQAGASINSETEAGWTPLMAASSQGAFEVARVLIEAGASANQRTSEGKSPLYLAALNGHSSVVAILLENGAEIIPFSNNGQESYATALSYRVAAETQIKDSQTPRARDCFENASKYFDTAAGFFEETSKQARKAALKKEFKQALAEGLMSVGEQYLAQVQASQWAQISALRKAASSGGGLQAYYSALREYDKTQINLVMGQLKVPTSKVDLEELQALEELTSKLAISSREAAAECRRKASELNPK